MTAADRFGERSRISGRSKEDEDFGEEAEAWKTRKLVDG